MKFSIRDVLWLTVVAALAVCWGIDRARIRGSELRVRISAERALLEATRARALEEREAALAQVLKQDAANAARVAEAAFNAGRE
jgi:hypothetical protein